MGRVNCNNLLPAENVLCEHYRLGSSMVILARAFCDYTKYSVTEFEQIMTEGISQNREFEKTIAEKPSDYFDKVHNETKITIEKIKANK